MVLETTLICLDNSEYSRNGDYLPSRLEAQRDAANLICGAKTNQNPENAVGLLTAAGDRAVVRVTPTQDVGKILQSLHDIQPEGDLDIIRAVQTAQLALKHRMHKNQKQRIVLFIGSPITTSERQLELLGRNLKKNNVALDIISFGDTGINSSKLNRLHTAVNSSDTSHFVEYSADTTRLLSDALMSSPIIRSPGEGPSGDLAAGGEIGADPNADPELYMALQISLQEEQARQARAAASEATNGEAAVTSAATVDQPTTTPAVTGNGDSETNVAASASAAHSAPSVAMILPPDIADIDALEGIDDDLRRALINSINDFQNPVSTSSLDGPTADQDTTLLSSASHEMAGAGDMSIIPPEEAATPVGTGSAKLASSEQVAAVAEEAAAVSSAVANAGTNMSSVSMIQQFLSGLPGVDTTNPALQEAVQQVMGSNSQQRERLQDNSSNGDNNNDNNNSEQRLSFKEENHEMDEKKDKS